MTALTINNANVETVVFEDLTVSQIIALENALKVAKKEARGSEKEAKAKIKAEKSEEMKKAVKTGDTVEFLFGSGKNERTATGIVVRTSDKSITVEAVDVFKNKDKGYVQFHRIVRIVEAVETVAVETVAVETVAVETVA